MICASVSVSLASIIRFSSGIAGLTTIAFKSGPLLAAKLTKLGTLDGRPNNGGRFPWPSAHCRSAHRLPARCRERVLRDGARRPSYPHAYRRCGPQRGAVSAVRRSISAARCSLSSSSTSLSCVSRSSNPISFCPRFRSDIAPKVGARLFSNAAKSAKK